MHPTGSCRARRSTGWWRTHVGDNFTYDAVGRLNAAWVPGHTLTYSFANSTCSLAPTAGRNTNRTNVVDNAVTTTYCYDAADKMVSVSGDTRYATIAYSTDGHGNTTTLGDLTALPGTYTVTLGRERRVLASIGYGRCGPPPSRASLAAGVQR